MVVAGMQKPVPKRECSVSLVFFFAKSVTGILILIFQRLQLIMTGIFIMYIKLSVCTLEKKLELRNECTNYMIN
jgi:hypothetical protein